MPNKNKYDSGHAIIPVAHPSGEVHTIEVPFGTPMQDLHDALLDAGYHKEPTREGSLEYSPEFRRASGRAWQDVAYGDLPQEAGFVVTKDGKIEKPALGKEIGQNEDKGSLTFQLPSDGAFATLHTHPRPTMNRHWTQQPSPADVTVAKSAKQNVYVSTSSGLWLVESDGHVHQVFKREDWATRKKPE